MQFLLIENFWVQKRKCGKAHGWRAVAPNATDKEHSVEFCYGRTISRELSRRRLDAEAPVHRQVSPCEIGVIHTGNETSFLSKYSLIHTITDAKQT
jgi:hypothetical protein